MFDSLVDFLWTARPSLFSGTGRFYGVRPLLAVELQRTFTKCIEFYHKRP
jgi:hypothetical protein